MKGLVRAAPTTERVQVGSRSARKHYGHEAYSKYDASLGHSISRWYASYRVTKFRGLGFAQSATKIARL